MSKKPTIIQGDQYKDARGSMSFVNTFLMDAVKRFYIISPENTRVIRAWQGHKEEEKWFFALTGRFLVVLIKIDNWKMPSDNLRTQRYILGANRNQVLHIPKG
jgi:dTDP-4-dehydrorhamnose 3,5-epimerase-like enzyme